MVDSVSSDCLQAAQRLDKRVIRLRSRMRRQWLALGEMLREVQEALAYRALGFTNSQHYVRQRLEISPRWAMYLINLVRKIEAFDIDHQRVSRLEISKCMEIFRLDHPERVAELIEEALAARLSLRDVRQRVQLVLGLRPVNSGEVVRRVWSFTLDQWRVIDLAIRYVRRSGPVSDTYALELICADFLAGVRYDAPSQTVPGVSAACPEKAIRQRPA